MQQKIWRLPILQTAIGLLFILLVLLFGLAWLVFRDARMLWALFFGRPNLNFQIGIPVEDFNGLSGWLQALLGLVQAIIEFGLLCFAFLGVRQVSIGVQQVGYMKEEAKRKRQDWENLIYRRLITPEAAAARKLLFSNLGKACTASLEEEIAGLDESGKGRNRRELQECLDKTRRKFDDIAGYAGPFEWTLTPTKCAGFDNIEALLNEYNYICKLMREDALSRTFATDQSLRNFVKVYRSLRPVIEVRGRLSKLDAVDLNKAKAGSSDNLLVWSAYASHYVEYCKVELGELELWPREAPGRVGWRKAMTAIKRAWNEYLGHGGSI